MILLYAGAFAILIWLLWSLVPRLVHDPQNDLMVNGFSVGVMLGFIVGMGILQVIFGLFHALCGFRSERLLIKYYDRANSNRADA